MLASLSKNTVKQYDVCFKKWWNFCKVNSINVFSASVPNVIYFLTQLYNKGCQYGTLNSYRSALSLIIGSFISKDDRMQRFFKGVFRLRPQLPKYTSTWDTNCVLDYLNSWHPNESISLDQLSKKTITLLALTTAHRIQTLSKINIKNIKISSQCICIQIPDIIKTSRPGSMQPVLYLPFFPHKPTICPAKTLSAYLDQTSSLRKSNHLFVSTKKPHKLVGSQTLSRWVKTTLGLCGIDTTVFSAHSTRHASTSHAHSVGVSVDAIRNTAGWSGNSLVFGKFYKRPILYNSNMSLARSIIDNQ